MKGLKMSIKVFTWSANSYVPSVGDHVVIDGVRYSVVSRLFKVDGDDVCNPVADLSLTECHD